MLRLVNNFVSVFGFVDICLCFRTVAQLRSLAFSAANLEGRVFHESHYMKLDLCHFCKGFLGCHSFLYFISGRQHAL